MSAADPQASQPEAQAEEGPWADVQRIESWAGEVRVNLIRLAALIAFYGHHLINVYLIQDDPQMRGSYHVQVTAVVIVWGLVVLALYYCLSRRWVPPALKYVATLCDIILITALLALPGHNPSSPLAVLYFLVIAAAALRLSLPLVYLATLGSMAAFLVALGCYVFFQVGTEEYYRPDSPYRISRTYEIILLLALGAAGILAGQLVRQVRRIVQGYPVAVEGPAEE
jgi:hypothetical protein